MTPKRPASHGILPATRPDWYGSSDKFVVVGDLWIAGERGHLSTVLGSCVSVCLWSKERRLGGMNHYLRPAARSEDTSYLGGNIAIVALLERMLDAGCRRRELVAKIFGGAHALPSAWNVGAENVLIAWSELRREKIFIGAADVGGSHGRALSFDVATGQVQVRRVESSAGRGSP